MEKMVKLNISLNSSFPRDKCLNQESWGRAITAVAASIILTGNVLVVLVLIKFPSSRFRPLHWFIVQLAVADFGVGLVLLFIGTFSRVMFETLSLMSSLFIYGALASTTSTSTLGVTFIALDRYLYIVKHRRYKSLVTRKRVAGAITAAMLVPLAVFVLGPSLGWNCVSSCDCRLYNANPTGQFCFGSHCSQMMTPFRSETVLIGGTSLASLLIASLALYAKIFQKVRFQRNCGIQKCRTKSEIRMIKTMTIVLTGFILTTGPLAVCCLVSFFYNERSLHFVMRVMVVISTVNSILNPFFYFWRIPHMYSNLRYMLRSWLSCCFPCLIKEQERTRDPRKVPFQSTLQAASLQGKRNSNWSLSQFKTNDRSVIGTLDQVSV